MGTTLAFGTYIPGSSLVHETNAQVKVVLTCALSIAAFFVKTWPGLLLMALLVVALYLLAQVKVTRALGGLKPVTFILAFTIIAHAFSANVPQALDHLQGQPGSLGLEWAWIMVGSFGVTADGLAQGLFFAFRIALLVAACCLLSFTTSSNQLLDGLMALMGPLGKLGVPVEDLCVVISIALRFIPSITSEAQVIVNAQRARCANFDSGSVIARIKAWIPVFVPLFVRLFKRADDLAVAMEARCYQGQGRTHLRQATLQVPSVIAGLLLLAYVVLVAVFL